MKQPLCMKIALGLLAVAWGSGGADLVMGQGRVAKFQSSARPFGLEIVDHVRVRNSDRRAKDFRKDFLKDFSRLDSQSLSRSITHGNQTSVLVDPSKIRLQHDYDTRVYFVNSSSAYHNTLGFNTSGGGIGSGNPQLIFPDASSRSRNRSRNQTLRSGDFVNLGTTKAGTKLDFFLIADGARGGTNVFSTEDSVNPDGIRHVMSHAQIFSDSPYLMLAFEDLYGGGDEDYNDLIVAIDVGQENVKSLVKTIGAPEPGAFVSLIMFVGVVFELRRRRKELDGP